MLAKISSRPPKLLLTEPQPECWERCVLTLLTMLFLLFSYAIVAKLVHRDPLHLLRPAARFESVMERAQ